MCITVHTPMLDYYHPRNYRRERFIERAIDVCPKATIASCLCSIAAVASCLTPSTWAAPSTTTCCSLCCFSATLGAGEIATEACLYLTANHYLSKATKQEQELIENPKYRPPCCSRLKALVLAKYFVKGAEREDRDYPFQRLTFLGLPAAPLSYTLNQPRPGEILIMY